MSRPPRPVTPAGLLTAALDRIVDRAQEAAGIDPDLLDALRDAQRLAGGLEPYVERCTSPESDTLGRLAARTRRRDWEGRRDGDAVVALEPEMLSGHVEGRALQFLVRMSRARRVLEIGMFTGYSALAMAEALPDGGRLVACELDGDVARFAAESFAEAPAATKIDIRLGPADQTLAQLAAAGEQFDFIFLDADKPGYLGYLRAILDTNLLAPGGTVCVDNTLMQGEPWRGGQPTRNGAAIAAFNDAVAADPRVEQVVLAVRDGMTLIRRAA
jgi:caffeoyl-CoA O-methyltransferase